MATVKLIGSLVRQACQVRIPEGLIGSLLANPSKYRICPRLLRVSRGLPLYE